MVDGNLERVTDAYNIRKSNWKIGSTQRLTVFREKKQFYSYSGVPKETPGLFLPSFSHKSPFEL